MKHIRLKIRPQFLESIIKGVKKHEYRLNTLERANLKNGDRITLVSNQNVEDFVVVTIRGIKKYCSWEEALKENWEEDFKGQFNSLEEVLEVCSRFYTRDQVKEYGIVKYDIEPLTRNLRKNRVLLDTNIIIHREGYNNVTFEVISLYKWLDKLKSIKLIYPKTRDEIKKYQDANTRKSIDIKLDSYETLIPNKIEDAFFNEVVSSFSKDENSAIDNEILYQVYDGLADLLITNDNKILKKAELLGIRKIVINVEEYLNCVEKEFPKKIDYKMLSVRKEKFGDIDLNDCFFDTLKEDYPGFDDWFHGKNQEEAYVFKSNNEVHGFLFIKTEYSDENDYLSIYPPLSSKKRLKVGTFKIDPTLKGFRLSERFLKIIFDNALNDNVEEIYVTLFENKRDEVKALRDVLCKWGFCYHGYKLSKSGEKESVFVKTLEKYDPTKDIKFNFPNLPNNQKMYMLPINSEYHTDLFPDSILKNEDMNLYSKNKGHLYSLEKIYVSNAFTGNAKPGDFIVVYRSGDRYPKRYSSVCTCLAILEDIIVPKTKEEYLKVCSNKSVFNNEELNYFYDSKKYRTVIKLIPYKTYFNKISLGQLIDAGFVEYDSGPRPFDEVPPRLYGLFLKEDKER